MDASKLRAEIQNAVSEFERNSGRIVGTIEIMESEMTGLESTEREFSRYIVIGLIQKQAPMEPVI